MYRTFSRLYGPWDSAFGVANFTLLRRDALITDLPRNAKEEDRRKLRTGSFRGKDLFVPDVVEAADLALKGFNVQQASINMMSLKQNTSYSVGRSSSDFRYRTNRDHDPPSHGSPPARNQGEGEEGETALTRT